MATPKSIVTTPSTRKSLQRYTDNQLMSILVQTKAEIFTIAILIALLHLKCCRKQMLRCH